MSSQQYSTTDIQTDRCRQTEDPMTATESTTTPTTGLPEAGTWSIDTSHSSVEFIVRHLMVAKVRGSFTDFSGTIEIGDSPEASSVAVEIQVASVSTRDAQRDGHLTSADFFDAENHPTITFRSTAVRDQGKNRYAVDGELTVLGTTKPVTLELTYQGTARDPWGNDKAVFSAETEIDREDWGLNWNQALETGGVLVGKKAKIEIEVEAVKPAPSEG
jgi:polyisoprenoid-binding protein YceI